METEKQMKKFNLKTVYEHGIEHNAEIWASSLEDLKEIVKESYKAIGSGKLQTYNGEYILLMNMSKVLYMEFTEAA